jgi:hypothetical protein
MTLTDLPAPRSPRKAATALPIIPPPMMTMRGAPAMPDILAQPAGCGHARPVTKKTERL